MKFIHHKETLGRTRDKESGKSERERERKREEWEGKMNDRRKLDKRKISIHWIEMNENALLLFRMFEFNATLRKLQKTMTNNVNFYVSIRIKLLTGLLHFHFATCTPSVNCNFRERRDAQGLKVVPQENLLIVCMSFCKQKKRILVSDLILMFGSFVFHCCKLHAIQVYK